jgi:DNA-binding CsgD family transcriptional regulator
MGTALQLARHASRRDLVAALDVVDAALQVGTEAQFGALMHRVRDVLPVERIDVGVAGLDAEGRIVRNRRLFSVDYPTPWVAAYRARGYHRVDPVARTLFASPEPLIWSQLRSRSPTPMEREFYATAADFGLRDGFAFGSRFDNTSCGSFFSCGGADLARSERHRRMLGYLAPFLHVALARLRMGQQHGKPQLTPREIEVLGYAKYGKTNWEISMALGLSSRVVKFHMENAMRKLNVANRTQAVAVALSQGLVQWS